MGNLTNENCCVVESRQNATISQDNGDSRDEYLAYWEVATLALMFVVAIVGNSLVILALHLRRHDAPRKKLARIYFFILHLSVADLLTAFLNVLPQLVWEITFRFQGGPILCKLVKFGQPLGPYLSSYVLTVTALDRYQAVCHPLNYCSVTSKRSKIMVYLAWGLSLALCVPQIFVFSYQEVSSGVWDCWATFKIPAGQQAYVTWYSISVFILPLLVLTYTYASICLVIWRNTGIIGEACSTHGGLLRKRTVISRAKINSIKQMIAVISFYAASSSPFIASLLWATWDPNASTSPFFAGAAFTILTLMSSLNSCVNPWIYLGLNRDLSQALMSRIFPSKEDSGKSHENHRQSIEIVPCSSNASSSGTSVRSYASRMTRYASTILRRSSSSSKELQPSNMIR